MRQTIYNQRNLLGDKVYYVVNEISNQYSILASSRRNCRISGHRHIHRLHMPQGHQSPILLSFSRNKEQALYFI